MKPSPDVMMIFNQYAGVEIAGKDCTFQGRRPRKIRIPDSSDATLKTLTEAFEQKGLTVRVIAPGQFGTDDFKPDRVNVHLERTTEDKFRVTNFTLG